MSKKAVLLIVLLVMCFLCLACIGLSYWGFTTFAGTITKETEAIKTTNLDYICSTAADITEDDAMYFTDTFTNKYTYIETQELLDEVFPQGFDCENLLPNDGKDFLAILTHGQGVSISTVNDQTTATLTFPSKDGTKGYTMIFVKIDDEWYIDDIY